MDGLVLVMQWMMLMEMAFGVEHSKLQHRLSTSTLQITGLSLKLLD